jgi:hypothetical protein
MSLFIRFDLCGSNLTSKNAANVLIVKGIVFVVPPQAEQPILISGKITFTSVLAYGTVGPLAIYNPAANLQRGMGQDIIQL